MYKCSSTLQSGGVTITQSGDTVSLKCGSLDTFTLSKETNGLATLLFHLVEQLQSTKAKLGGTD